MKEFLLLFWNEAGDGQYQIDAEKMKEGMAAWQSWIGNIAGMGKLISTKPINYGGITIGNSKTTEEPAILEGKMVTGYLLCKADGVEEVQEWAASCPILFSPQGFTEIREISPFEM